MASSSRLVPASFALLLVVITRPVAAQETDGERFTVTEYRVLGNSVLQTRDIETALYPQLGPEKTIANVEQVRELLEKLYRDRGYGAVYVDIPEQSVDGGVVRLQVTEGRLARVRISGARYFSNGMIRDRLPALNHGEVLKLPELQAQLGELNQQSRDRAITPVLKAGQSPGTVDVELKVQDTLPVHGSVEVNNRYTANTSHTRASINLSYENLFQRFHNLSLQYQTAPEEPDESRVFAATYVAPVGPVGNMLAVYAVTTDSDFAVVNTGGDLGVIGAGNIYGARYIVRLPAGSGYFHNFTFGGDYKDFADNIVLPDGTADTTPIQYAAWSAVYGGNLMRERSTTAFNVGANFGIRGLVNDDADFAYKRYGASGNYFYLRADATENFRFWREASVNLKLSGQWTPDPVISNEQFSAGGADSVRGYLESTQLGDTGFNAMFELRSPPLRASFFGDEQMLTLLAFYDMASLRQIDQRIENNAAYNVYVDLASAGAGLRFEGLHGLNAALDWAYPFKDAGETLKGDSRVHFQVRYGF